ncbi:MAG: DNA primase [Candidatus Blackburnbacteria bacterium]|nr:DNA primase [Candidatus Blackburnbacteria bacterium]
MAQDQIEEIKNKVDIVELISEFVELKKAGRNYRGLCPFHSEKTPSFMVSSELQIFKCFGCGLGGDCYRFLMEYEKADFPQVLKILADRVGVQLQPLRGFVGFQEKEEIYKVNQQALELYHYLLISHPLGESSRAYLRKRGIKDEAIKQFRLGLAIDRPNALFRFLTEKRKQNPVLLEKAGLVVRRDGEYFDRFRARLIFPLKDHHGNTVGFSGRVLVGEREVAKYINSPDTLVYKKGQMLYGLDVTKQEIKKADFAVVVEGEFDLISPWQVGVKNVVAIKGSALTPEQAGLLSRFCSRVYLALDSDFAGDKAAWRGIDIVQSKGLEVRIVDLNGFKDPDEMAQKDAKGLRQAIEKAQGAYDFFINSTFKKYDSTTTEGKAKISRELSPILVNIEDEIVKATCISQVARRLGVSEQAVLREVEKKIGSRKPGTVNMEGNENLAKSRRVLLEEGLLSLIFQTNPVLVVEKNVKRVIKDPILRRLVELFEGYSVMAEEDVGSLSFFANQLPAELKDVFASLLLREALKEDEVDTELEVEDIIKTIQVLEEQGVMEGLTMQIKELEYKGEMERVGELEVELNNSVKRLLKLKEGS